MKKYTIEYIQQAFEKENYILLSIEYINNKLPLHYVCPNGHKGTINWDRWNNSGCRCAQCSGNIRYDIDHIKKSFEVEGYILLSKIYINAHKKLNYICPEGHEHSMSWNKWQSGRRCPTCAFKIRHDKLRLDYTFVKNSFEKEGYKLLSKNYKTARINLDYICPMGHKSSISWDSWYAGHRCRECFVINNMGINNCSWRGGKSFEEYCSAWKDVEYKEAIKERDSNMCLNPSCFKVPCRLSTHHVDYNKKNCKPSNLITLCVSCNSRANYNRKWHRSWYQAILNKRYGYEY